MATLHLSAQILLKKKNVGNADVLMNVLALGNVTEFH